MIDPREEMMERLLQDAGVTAGMHVLDIGCGVGNLTAVLSKLIGERGRVLGVDRDAASLAMAQDRMRQMSISNATFLHTDLAALPADIGPFDAAVGRRVLMYVPDPVPALGRISAVVRPGGVIVFQEQDASMVPGRIAPWPLHEQVYQWVWRTVEREGANLHIGFDLPFLLEKAGLTVEHLRAEAVVLTPKTENPIANIARVMVPRIVDKGVATAEQIDIDTLEARLSAERAAATSAFVSDMVFGAWARKPAV